MNKKQARKARQQRNKQREQNERHFERNQKKQKATRDFQVKLIDDERKEYIAAHCSGKGDFDDLMCLVCDKKILKKDLKAKRFIALSPNTDKTHEYFAHSIHFYEEDGVTVIAEHEANFQKMFALVMKKELKDLLYD